MAGQKPITMLHISDLQFGPHHRFEGPGSASGLLGRLRDDLDELRSQDAIRPDLVLITGDLTEYGVKSQFEQLFSFAQGLTEVTELPPRRIVVVPGNHDVNWKLSQAYFAEREGNEERPRLPYWPKLRPYAEFFARFYEGQPGIAFTEGEPWSLFEYPDLGAVVAGLNSAIAESHRPEDHYGFLGEEQLRFFAGKLRPYKEQGLLRIAAVHHDPREPGGSDAARQDAKDFRGMLLPYVNVVLHGHLHEEQLGWLDNNVPVLGIGSAGVKVPERPPEVPNQYQVVQVHADGIAYGTRAYVPDQKRWIGCLRADRDGRAWWLTKKVAFDDVATTFSARPEIAAPLAELAQMVDAYRRHWAKAYRHEALFDLAAMGEDADIPAGLDLLHVFLPQTAHQEPPRHELPRDFGGDLDDDVIRGGDPRRSRLDPLGLATSLTGPPRPIDEIVSERERTWLLILGAPGAGKSALTRWLTLRLCTAGESLGDLPPDLVPVRIELRRFDLQRRQARDAGRAYDFFDYLDDLHRDHGLSLRGEPLRRLAQDGRLLWLFDGLDEVADAHARREYAAMIVGVRERHGGRGIVASRIVGARVAQPLFRQAGFTTYTLQDFDDAQIVTFLERWHRLALPGAPGVGTQRLERLRRTLAESRPVRELCGNPLLLTLIALLNRGAELPRQRHLVYERAVDLMADQWEANKPFRAADPARFDLSTKKRFLRQLAFAMMTSIPGGAGNAVRQRDLFKFAAAFCEQELTLCPEEARSTAEHLIEHLRERNYILALLGGQTFGFVHKTFLEYLTAVEILARFRAHTWGFEELKEVFRKHWMKQSWEETLTLICGMIEEERPEQVIALLQGVLERIPLFHRIVVDELVAFALRCFAEVRLLDQEPARNFARALLAWVWQFDFPIHPPTRLLSALLLRGPEWPDAANLVADAIEIIAKSSDKALKSRLAHYAVALSAKQERALRLAQLIQTISEPYVIQSVIREAGQFAAWTDAEVKLLDEAIEKTSEATKIACWSSLLASGADRAADRLLGRVRHSTQGSVRFAAASALLRSRLRVPEAKSALFELLRSNEHYVSAIPLLFEGATDAPTRKKLRGLLQATSSVVRLYAAREMALSWHDDEGIALWMDSALREDDAQVSLYGGTFLYVDVSAFQAMIQGNTTARRLWDDLLREPAIVKNFGAKIFVAVWMASHDDVRGVDMLAELANSPTLELGFRDTAAFVLLDIPAGRQRALIALLRMYDDRGADRIPFALGNLSSDDTKVLSEVLRLSKEARSESMRLSTSQTLWQHASYRADALRSCQALAKCATDDGVRIGAAVMLRDAQRPASEWRPVLTRLARSAKRGADRLHAAEELGDERRIAQLATRSKRAEVRKRAAHDLARLRAYRALLAVGRPRRGVVSLDGTRAGIIEETPHGSRFTYDRAYLDRPGAVPLSLTLPLRPEPYDSRGLHPFFENLLPEGWLLDQTCRKLGLDRTDAFGLMLATCADCAGDVEIVAEELPGAA